MWLGGGIEQVGQGETAIQGSQARVVLSRGTMTWVDGIFLSFFLPYFFLSLSRSSFQFESMNPLVSTPDTVDMIDLISRLPCK